MQPLHLLWLHHPTGGGYDLVTEAPAFFNTSNFKESTHLPPIIWRYLLGENSSSEKGNTLESTPENLY